MFCKYCGNSIPENSKFCPSCGRAVSFAAAQDGAQPESAGREQRTGYRQPEDKQPDYAGRAYGPSAMDRFLSVIGPQPYFTVGSYIVWGGCFISFASLFLCFCTVTLFSTHLVSIMELNGSGWIIVLLLAIAVLNLFKLYVGDLICTGIVAFYIWHYAVNIDELLNVFGYAGGLFGAETIADGMISFSFGFYLMIFGLFLMLAGGIWGLVRTILDCREA